MYEWYTSQTGSCPAQPIVHTLTSVHSPPCKTSACPRLWHCWHTARAALFAGSHSLRDTLQHTPHITHHTHTCTSHTHHAKHITHTSHTHTCTRITHLPNGYWYEVLTIDCLAQHVLTASMKAHLDLPRRRDLARSTGSWASQCSALTQRLPQEHSPPRCMSVHQAPHPGKKPLTFYLPTQRPHKWLLQTSGPCWMGGGGRPHIPVLCWP